MCGIAGWLGRKRSNDNIIADGILKSLSHRGPDDNKFLIEKNFGLLFSRLSIMDLSENGMQPLSDNEGHVFSVFNGEIYNYLQLRKEINSAGFALNSTCDAETIPFLYKMYGINFVKKLKGMFAIALYDEKNQSLFIIRDRFGIKPLFYSMIKDRVYFSSEINSLKLISEIDLNPNTQSISDFTMLSYIPAPNTFYKGILSLEPAEIIHFQLSENRISKNRNFHYKLNINPDSDLSFAESIKNTSFFFDKAVKNQLRSDVPLGALLSGGIDSSLISESSNRALNGDLNTFSVGFNDSDYDESQEAKFIAKSIGSKHNQILTNNHSLSFNNVKELLLHCGQPFADSSIFAVNMISKLMTEQIKVALSGDGGDESFGGYELYRNLKILGLARNIPLINSFNKKLRKYKKMSDQEILLSQFVWISQNEYKDLFLVDNKEPVIRFFENSNYIDSYNDLTWTENIIAKATDMNFRLLLPNDFLFKVDMGSMKEGMEIRVPFLDEELVDFAHKIPSKHKVGINNTKKILRKIAGQRLPRSISKRKKTGFAIPMDIAVESEFKNKINDIFINNNPQINHFYNKDLYRPWVDSFCKNKPFKGISRTALYQRIIMLLSLELHLS